ncbi:MAG: hypothetical protein VX829_10310 [Pseudomonadota bacterium]|uniref:Uncharacterized protein n=2 Tax=Methylophaga TaxID=40222 RepID=F5SUY1_9GAMM|nr:MULTISPECIES: hypothetical protein [Methylophaga]EGL55567.1 hypothetical protein MAMP_02561 [Methylophaga aminisulfidivorans MP]MEC9413051.1 hypothetical protein [Pseudomonadota bacterium]GLP98834.1 hypothetical protein GCM10007891_06880 [Methylophaga thalassica]
MKKLALAWLMFVSVFAHADELTKEETCEGWANKAEQFMEVRQNNVPIHEAMKMTVGNFSRGLMLRAYNEPVAENEGEKQAVIDHFAELIEDECLKNAQ